jgi:hypothetical protein
MRRFWGVVFVLATAVAHPAGMTWQHSPAGSSAHAAQPVKVEIVSAPDNGSDWDLAIATWALAAGTIVLCFITGVGVRKQGRDTERSLTVAQASADAASKSAAAAAATVEAAARHRRDDLEREVNSTAHRVITMAAQVHELAKQVPTTVTTSFALAGRQPLPQIIAPYQQEMKDRQDIAKAATSAGAALLSALERKAPDSELAAGLKDMDVRLVTVELIMGNVTRELESFNSQIALQRQINEGRIQAADGRIPPPILGR